MDAGQIIAIAFLAVLTLSVLGSFLAQSRSGKGRAAQNLSIWALIFVGLMAAGGLWQDISRDFTPRQASIGEGRIEVPRGRDGHYHLTLEVNGVPVDFLVDTGATNLVLNMEDAARVGLDPANLPFIYTALTANGEVRTAPVTLDLVRLGDIEDRNFRASVNEGELERSLLGMAYLGRFESIEIRRDVLILTR